MCYTAVVIPNNPTVSHTLFESGVKR